MAWLEPCCMAEFGMALNLAWQKKKKKKKKKKKGKKKKNSAALRPRSAWRRSSHSGAGKIAAISPYSPACQRNANAEKVARKLGGGEQPRKSARRSGTRCRSAPYKPTSVHLRSWNSIVLGDSSDNGAEKSNVYIRNRMASTDGVDAESSCGSTLSARGEIHIIGEPQMLRIHPPKKELNRSRSGLSIVINQLTKPLVLMVDYWTKYSNRKEKQTLNVPSKRVLHFRVGRRLTMPTRRYPCACSLPLLKSTLRHRQDRIQGQQQVAQLQDGQYSGPAGHVPSPPQLADSGAPFGENLGRCK